VADSSSDTVRRGTEVVVTGYDSIILKVRPYRGNE
jgi:membrane protein implicated in regulation of membrane protease activity